MKRVNVLLAAVALTMLAACTFVDCSRVGSTASGLVRCTKTTYVPRFVLLAALAILGVLVAGGCGLLRVGLEVHHRQGGKRTARGEVGA
jgi:hypothetical protein